LNPMPAISPPTLLTISGHDPSGGAGIQADIEAATANGCAATSVVTCLTVQDTRNLSEWAPIEPGLVNRQARTLLADIPIQAIKIGLLGNDSIAQIIGALLSDYPQIPVVLDPVLASGGGTELAGKTLLDSIRLQLLPHTTLITPNSLEARRLTGLEDLDACASKLLSLGCGAVLITGTHEKEREVSNRLYHCGEKSASLWPRLPGEYHGSGCTLASSIAAFLARGRPLEEAVLRGQEYTWKALSQGYRSGRGQLLPDRFFFSR